MSTEIIDIEVYKVISKAIIEPDNMEDAASRLTQIIVASLKIKGCSMFALNPATGELEMLANTGLSIKYQNKGPILAKRSLDRELKGEPVVVKDINHTNLLQYPDAAKEEGIGAIISVPIKLHKKMVGALRLYHHDTWNISHKDLDSLKLLARTIGLTMMYSRLLNAMQDIRNTVDEIHPVWLQTK